jgi:hypothetical protein
MLPVRGVHYDVGHQYDAGPGQAPRSTRPHLERAGVEAVTGLLSRLNARTAQAALRAILVELHPGQITEAGSASVLVNTGIARRSFGNG